MLSLVSLLVAELALPASAGWHRPASSLAASRIRRAAAASQRGLVPMSISRCAARTCFSTPLAGKVHGRPRHSVRAPALSSGSGVGCGGFGDGSGGGGEGGGGGDGGSGKDGAPAELAALPIHLLRNHPGLVLLCLCGTVWFVYHNSEAGVAESVRGVFEAGGVQGWSALFAADRLPLVPRPQLHEELTQLLRPDEYAQYAVVVGAAGTGKSTAVRRAVAALGQPKGVVYFLCSTLLTGFSSELAASLGYRRPIGWAGRLVRLLTGETREEVSSPPLTAEPHATWQRLEPILVSAAQLYYAKHGKPAVLVLDGLDQVAKEDARFFAKLQDFAKKCADMRILRLVLVFSDGLALPMLQSSSAFTRAGIVLEVGDLSDAEATSWLVSQLGVQPQRAQELVQSVTGGRFPLLLAAAASSQSLDAMRRQRDVQTRVSLRRAGVRADARLLRLLCSAGCVSADQAEALMPLGQIEQLLARNILSVHPDRMYTFHDRAVECFFMQAAQR
jgi:hypothetical protein